MDIFFLNTQNGESDTVASPAIATLHLAAQTPAAVYVRCETAFTPGTSDLAWDAMGSANPAYPDPQNEVQSGGSTSKIAALVKLPALAPGRYNLTVSVRVQTVGYAGIYAISFGVVVEGGALAAEVDWSLPAALIDLQFDLRSRAVSSARFAVAGAAIKSGDDLQLAIIPSVSGTAITSLVTAMKVSLRRKDRPFAGALAEIEETGTPLAPLEDGAGNKYWLIEMPLTGPAVDDFWAEINGIAAADTATEAQLAATRGVECDLEVRVTWDDGVYTGKNMAFTLLQAIEDAPTEV